MGELRFAGVDWASEEHAVCVVDERGRIVEGRRYRHNEPGIRALCSRLVRLGVKLVALERPDGLLIERLLDAGLAVIAVHPNQVKASRPRYSVAGGKSDGFDSFVLAELARTDSHRFRVLVPDSDQTKALRAMTRARESLVRTRVGLANQLRDQLACFWPGASKVFCERRLADRAGVPAPLPHPGRCPRAGEQRLAAFLKRHGYTGRKPAGELLERLRGGRGGPRRRARDGRPPPDRARARLRAGADRCADQRADDRDPPRARTRTRTGRRSARCSSPPTRGCAPRAMLAEIGDCRDRYPTYRALAADAGQCPGRRRVRQSQTRPVPLGVRSPPARKRSTRSLTQAAATTRGRPTSMTAPARAAPATRTPAASSAAPGARSSGASGRTTTPTTPSSTPRCNG